MAEAWGTLALGDKESPVRITLPLKCCFWHLEELRFNNRHPFWLTMSAAITRPYALLISLPATELPD